MPKVDPGRRSVKTSDWNGVESGLPRELAPPPLVSFEGTCLELLVREAGFRYNFRGGCVGRHGSFSFRGSVSKAASDAAHRD